MAVSNREPPPPDKIIFIGLRRRVGGGVEDQILARMPPDHMIAATPVCQTWRAVAAGEGAGWTRGSRHHHTQPRPNRGSHAALEQQMAPRLDGLARSANLRRSTVFVEEVGAGTEPVDVRKVSEDLEVRRQPEPPSRASGGVGLTRLGEHPVGSPG
jgi:hypothetical protein